MGIKRLLRRALWMEALHEAYPNRLTFWLWKRAVNKLRAERDRGRVTCAPGFRSSFASFTGSLTGPARKARKAQAAYDYQRHMAAAGLLQSAAAQRASHGYMQALGGCGAEGLRQLLNGKF